MALLSILSRYDAIVGLAPDAGKTAGFAPGAGCRIMQNMQIWQSMRNTQNMWNICASMALAVVGLAPDAGKTAGFAPGAGCSCNARCALRPPAASLWTRATRSAQSVPRCPPRAAGCGGEVRDGALRNGERSSDNWRRLKAQMTVYLVIGGLKIRRPAESE